MRIKSESKVRRKYILQLKQLKIDGCMHPLFKIDQCSCTLCTRYYEGPVLSNTELRRHSVLTYVNDHLFNFIHPYLSFKLRLQNCHPIVSLLAHQNFMECLFAPTDIFSKKTTYWVLVILPFFWFIIFWSRFQSCWSNENC